MDKLDPLQSAAQELTSVAAEIREVKKRADQYGQATSRLHEIGVAVTQLTAAVSSIQSQFQELLTTAQASTSQLGLATLAAENAAQSIPTVVARIEAADVSKSVGDFSRSLDAVNNQFAKQLDAIVGLQVALTAEHKEQRDILDSVIDRTGRLAESIERVADDVGTLKSASTMQSDQLLQAIAKLDMLHASSVTNAELGRGIQAAADKAANASAAYGHKTLRTIADLGQKVEALQLALDTQGKALSKISEKRGLLF